MRKEGKEGGRRLPFWAYPAVSLLVYAVLPFFFPLSPRYAERLADVRTFAPTIR